MDMFWIVPVLAAIFTIFAIITNPYLTGFFKTPFRARLVENDIIIEEQSKLTARNNSLLLVFAFFKCGIHILTNNYFGSKKAKSTTWKDIIADVHALRFDTRKAYLICGDHFSVLYPRNFGVFFQTTLDPRVAISQDDWIQKQAMYSQSLAFALETFRQLGDLTTTIVPTARERVTGINIYAYPSDTLYSLLFGLKAMQTPDDLINLYPFKGKSNFTLMTTKAGTFLLEEYREALTVLYKKYKRRVYDDTTGLINKYIHLSGTKDITQRSCAFYDNVVFWRTTQLAQELGILPENNEFLTALKTQIIKTFWYEEGGYFLEDLSEAGTKNQYYSSDWLIVVMTGFLSINKPEELPYLKRSIEYIQKQKIDKPFPLRYQQDNRSQRQYPLVKMIIPAYGGTIIWSHWGIEYIKLLLMLGKQMKNDEYTTTANEFLDIYKKNIEKYRGYPEVYTTEGAMVQGPIYTSVRQTGWVVNFEQAVAMAEAFSAPSSP